MNQYKIFKVKNGYNFGLSSRKKLKNGKLYLNQKPISKQSAEIYLFGSYLASLIIDVKNP